ncbi:MAG: YigZ family protein [Roseburia sp.]
MKIIYKGGEGEIVEKKSRFIATVRPISSEEEATAFINEMKKKYWDARHNCSAFTIGENHETCRCSDDGEPSQTAGRPMLDVLLKEDIHNVAVVVTRYFGGTLLGTGGLVRTYQKATQEGIAASQVIDRREGKELKIGTDYTGMGKIQYLLGKRNLPILDTVYTEKVELSVLVPKEETAALEKEIVEATNATADICWGEERFFAIVEKNLIIL